MADLGLSGAYAVSAMQQAVRQRIKDQLDLQQQQFTNQQTQNTSDRADRALNQQDVLTKLKIQESADAKKAAETDKQFTIGKTLTDTIPADTIIPTTSAAVPPLQLVGALRKEDATLPSTSTVGIMSQGPTPGLQMRGRLVSQTSSPGNPEQFRKLPSAAQQNTAADNARADAALPLEGVGPNNILTPRAKAIGQPGFQRPIAAPQPVVIQTDAGPQLVNRGAGTASPITQEGTGEVVKAAPSAGVAVKDADKKHAIDTLNQVDVAIDNAKDLIGPGAGRVSTLEQMIGNADPRVNALGTKLLLAKMQVDAGIGGARAAASPQLLARWDGLLSQKVTPEGLKASIQAMREILGGSAPPQASTPPAKASAEDLIRKYSR